MFHCHCRLNSCLKLFYFSLQEYKEGDQDSTNERVSRRKVKNAESLTLMRLKFGKNTCMKSDTLWLTSISLFSSEKSNNLTIKTKTIWVNKSNFLLFARSQNVFLQINIINYRVWRFWIFVFHFYSFNNEIWFQGRPRTNRRGDTSFNLLITFHSLEYWTSKISSDIWTSNIIINVDHDVQSLSIAELWKKFHVFLDYLFISCHNKVKFENCQILLKWISVEQNCCNCIGAQLHILLSEYCSLMKKKNAKHKKFSEKYKAKLIPIDSVPFCLWRMPVIIDKICKKNIDVALRRLSNYSVMMFTNVMLDVISMKVELTGSKSKNSRWKL